jgi:hypothetical protein
VANSYLTQGLGILDAIIGECEVGLNVSLHTFNKKHFRAISSLKVVEPYTRLPTLPAGNP